MSRICLALLLVASLATAGFAQTPPVIGNEIFVVPDWASTSSGLNTDWDNIVVDDLSGNLYTIGFSVLPTSPNGTYGTMATDGAYVLEAFWADGATNLPLGITSGHHHINTGGTGNPGNFERAHSNGTGTPVDFQGYVLRRTDGAAFRVHSIDYRNQPVSFRIGTYTLPTVYANYNEILTNWVVYGASSGVVLNDPTWRTLNFGSAVADDLAVTGITSPVNPSGCDVLGNAESITIQMTNYGSNTIAGGLVIPVAYTPDGGTTLVMESFTVPATMMPFTSVTHTFATTVDMSIVGSYTIDAFATMPGDLDANNNGRSVTFDSGGTARVSTFPWKETFDTFGAANGARTPPPGWVQDQTDGGGTGIDDDWYFRNNQTPSGNTGPNTDNSGTGFYMYVEDASDHTAVNMTTPCIDISGLTNPHLKFWMHSNNGTTPTTTNENTVGIGVLTYPGAVAVNNIVTPIGHIGPNWTLQIIDISAFAGGEIQIRLRGRSDGGGTLHDIAIDDFEVFDSIPGIGQPPLPGLALMDINGSQSGNGLPVSFAAPGPYFAQATPGSPLTFYFEGEVNQPIVVLVGALNPAVATIPLIGIFDIGGPVGANGLPTNLGVIANGLTPSGFNIFFNTTPIGSNTISFTMPFFPPGVLTTFQAAIFNTQPQTINLTNAIELTVL